MISEAQNLNFMLQDSKVPKNLSNSSSKLLKVFFTRNPLPWIFAKLRIPNDSRFAQGKKVERPEPLTYQVVTLWANERISEKGQWYV